MKKIAVVLILSLLIIGQAYSQAKSKQTGHNMKQPETDHYTFKLSDKVTRQKVTFENRYGILIAGDLYVPKNRGSEALAALAISGPFGAVKEQSSGLYAIAGEEAHSRYFSEDTYKAAAEPKELMIIPDANHVDLYDKVNIIPFH